MKHTGGCHCGTVRYEVEMNITEGLSCNCSICQRKGTLLAFAPASQFRLLSGEQNLQDYQFGKKVIHHTFCKTCGVTSFASAKTPDGVDMRAINIRCIDGIELEKIPVKSFNGRDLN